MPLNVWTGLADFFARRNVNREEHGDFDGNLIQLSHSGATVGEQGLPFTPGVPRGSHSPTVGTCNVAASVANTTCGSIPPASTCPATVDEGTPQRRVTGLWTRGQRHGTAVWHVRRVLRAAFGGTRICFLNRQAAHEREEPCDPAPTSRPLPRKNSDIARRDSSSEPGGEQGAKHVNDAQNHAAGTLATGLPTPAPTRGVGQAAPSKGHFSRSSSGPLLGPSTSQTLIVFDWDDTLFCTSFVNQHSGFHIRTSKRMQAVASATRQLLETAQRLGRTFIITNAAEEWVYRCSFTFAKELLPVLEGVDIISARDLYEDLFPHQAFKWKVFAFLELRRRVEFHGIKNFLVFGDSDCEMDAARVASEAFSKVCLKRIKFVDQPSPEELVQEVKLVHQTLPSIVQGDTDFKFVFARNQTPRVVEPNCNGNRAKTPRRIQDGKHTSRTPARSKHAWAADQPPAPGQLKASPPRGRERGESVSEPAGDESARSGQMYEGPVDGGAKGRARDQLTTNPASLRPDCSPPLKGAADDDCAGSGTMNNGPAGNAPACCWPVRSASLDSEPAANGPAACLPPCGAVCTAALKSKNGEFEARQPYSYAHRVGGG
mmetsp:Transcript_73466/g.204089  ORF Transcript_73466/g.204089 Transcript_73466/m.204089 type:complete len:601 (-) Transcript_73466:114-1916(-)